MKKIELLAPAGNLERLKVARAYGANAVYIGGQKYSLRARASNFTLEDMKEDKTQKNNHIPDMTDMDEIRKAIIANEILNRKY